MGEIVKLKPASVIKQQKMMNRPIIWNNADRRKNTSQYTPLNMSRCWYELLYKMRMTNVCVFAWFGTGATSTKLSMFE